MSNLVDHKYLSGISGILATGVKKVDRTGTGTISTFGALRKYNLRGNRLPVISTKKIFLRSIVHELIWFISGSTNIAYLKQNNVSIWDSWVKEATAQYDEEGKLVSGELGKGTYGEAWRNLEDIRIISKDECDYHFKGFHLVCDNPEDQNTLIVKRNIDQLQNAIDTLRTNPDSRRIIVQAFDNRYADFAALPPCHSFFQFYSRPIDKDGKRELDLLIYLRSNDGPAGEPFNIASYALLCMMVANITGHEVGNLVYVNGDHHIYLDQVELVGEQLSREILNNYVTVEFSEDIKEIDDYSFEDILIRGYDNFHPSIKYPVSV